MESKVFQDYVDKKVMVKFDELEETIDQFKKKTERSRDVTRECVIKIDDDITTLWDKVMGNGVEKTDTHKVAGLTEVEGGNQSMSRNEDLVIAHTEHSISIPINQSGLQLDTSSSNSFGKGIVNEVCLGVGNKRKSKERVMKRTGGCIPEE